MKKSPYIYCVTVLSYKDTKKSFFGMLRLWELDHLKALPLTNYVWNVERIDRKKYEDRLLIDFQKINPFHKPKFSECIHFKKRQYKYLPVKILKFKHYGLINKRVLGYHSLKDRVCLMLYIIFNWEFLLNESQWFWVL